MKHDVTALEVQDDRRIAVIWNDGVISRFHFVWLRQQFFHPATGRPDQQPGEPLRLPDDPDGLIIEDCNTEHGCLIVRWQNDNAVTCHDLAWLRLNAYDREQRLARKVRQQTWTGMR